MTSITGRLPVQTKLLYMHVCAHKKNYGPQNKLMPVKCKWCLVSANLPPPLMPKLDYKHGCILTSRDV